MLLTSCLQGHSFQRVFQLVFPTYTLQLPSRCVLPTVFKKIQYVPKSRKFSREQAGNSSDISNDISSLWARESTSLNVNKANGMLTSNAKRIFCYNVTCCGTNKSCSNRSHLQECFQCSSLLACKGTAFNVFSN